MMKIVKINSHNNKLRVTFIVGVVLFLNSCYQFPNKNQQLSSAHKVVIYQVLPRLFGNVKQSKVPWGTIEQNGVGKFNDFNETAIKAIKKKGFNYIWYTGILHHALIGDYRKYGISNDDPDVVKGRAGSPYAIKDYYNVDPDLAVDPADRMNEFRALIKRTHQQGMKVIIDMVPNHVARNYHSISAPEGINDFGANDDKTVAYKRDNNFYYLPGEDFKVPEALKQQPKHIKNILTDHFFKESPAKWTGNNVRVSQPDINDWYETVKINFGIRPDGSKDFPVIENSRKYQPTASYYQWWKNKSVPDSWIKFKNIAKFWIDQGVDGFRYDTAEMVPVEFWSYLNSYIKHIKPDAVLIGEVYNPKTYRQFIYQGKMDYLYDKVGFYDTERNIISGKENTDQLSNTYNELNDIQSHMLHFLENHDEQRIASSQFANCKKNCAELAKPAMVVASLINSGPIMIYFGQDVGEKAQRDAGFGQASRTTIFDYWNVPGHQRWMNHGKFDGGGLTPNEKSLQNFYKNLLTYIASSKAVMGQFGDIHSFNRKMNSEYTKNLFSFVRWKEDEKLIVLSNFNAKESYQLSLIIPPKIISQWGLNDDQYQLDEVLYHNKTLQFNVEDGQGFIALKIEPLQSFVLELSKKIGK